MKRVVMLIPDEILFVSGTSTQSRKEKIPVDTASLKQVLEHRHDYHMRWSFEEGSTHILALEDTVVDQAERGQKPAPSTSLK